MRIVSILIILASMIPLLAVDATDSRVVQTGGTVVAFGSQPTVPAGLTDVISISAVSDSNYALKKDGTVIFWGMDGRLQYYEHLTNIVKLVGGIALKGDGTIRCLGGYSFECIDIVSVAVSLYEVLGLKKDGTVLSGSSVVPLAHKDIVKIAAGGSPFFVQVMVICMGHLVLD